MCPRLGIEEIRLTKRWHREQNVKGRYVERVELVTDHFRRRRQQQRQWNRVVVAFWALRIEIEVKRGILQCPEWWHKLSDSRSTCIHVKLMLAMLSMFAEEESLKAPKVVKALGRPSSVHHHPIRESPA